MYQNATGTAPTPHNDDDVTTYEADDNGEDNHQDSVPVGELRQKSNSRDVNRCKLERKGDGDYRLGS